MTDTNYLDLTKASLFYTKANVIFNTLVFVDSVPVKFLRIEKQN